MAGCDAMVAFLQEVLYLHFFFFFKYHRVFFFGSGFFATGLCCYLARVFLNPPLLGIVSALSIGCSVTVPARFLVLLVPLGFTGLCEIIS